MPTKTAKKNPNKSKTARPTTGEKVTMKHEFTVDEYRERTRDLTRSMELMDEKEANYKAAAATAKAEIKELRARVTEMRNQLSNGYENKEVDALVEFNRKKGSKRYFLHSPGNPEHGNFIKESPMSEEDFQLLIDVPLDEKPAQTEPAPEAQQEPPAETA